MDTNDLGRSAAPSGSRASHEAASSTASSPEASIPNALREIVSGLSRYIGTFLPATPDYNAVSEKGVARQVLSGLAVALDSAASVIEARRAATTKIGAVHESAVGAAERPTPVEERIMDKDKLVEAVVALADGADKCTAAPHFIVQPFFGIYRKHGDTIAQARAAALRSHAQQP